MRTNEQQDGLFAQGRESLESVNAMRWIWSEPDVAHVGMKLVDAAPPDSWLA